MSDDANEHYHDVQVEVSEEHLEGLAHGSGVTYEFTDDDVTLAVHVDSERELDKDWLRGERSEASGDFTRKWKAVAGLTVAMVGMLWAATPLVDVYPMYVGGLISVLGGIIVLDQLDAAESSNEVVV